LARRGARWGLAGDALASALHPLTTRIASHGELNFLFSDGDFLVAHAHTRLHALSRTCTRDGQPTQRVSLLATVPLTDEPWRPLEPGTLHIFRGGVEVASLRTTPPTEATFAVVASPLGPPAAAAF
jgi:glutamine amidotransferase